jgi:hypothetical protein
MTAPYTRGSLCNSRSALLMLAANAVQVINPALEAQLMT